MKKWLTILSAVGISATMSGSVLACTYKTSTPVNYQKFTDFNVKNFDKLGEGRVLLYGGATNGKQTKIAAGDPALQQSIKAYYEGDGSEEVKNLVASGFANYSKTLEVLNDATMSVFVQNVQSITDSTYQVSFQIQQKISSTFTKKSELLRFEVATDSSKYQVLSESNLLTIAGATKLTYDINALDSIFRKDFVETANFLLGLNPVDRLDIANNGVMSLNNWFDTTNNFNNQWIAYLKTGLNPNDNNGVSGTIYLPGVDSEGKQYQSIRAQINDSALGLKKWRNQFAISVIELVLEGIHDGVITSDNYHQIGLYQVDTLVYPDHLRITNTGVVNSSTLESRQ